jgi:hypothetical protein
MFNANADNESDNYINKRSSLKNDNPERELSKINDVEIDYKNDFRNSRNTFSKQFNYETINSRLDPSASNHYTQQLQQHNWHN